MASPGYYDKTLAQASGFAEAVTVTVARSRFRRQAPMPRAAARRREQLEAPSRPSGPVIRPEFGKFPGGAAKSQVIAVFPSFSFTVTGKFLNKKKSGTVTARGREMLRRQRRVTESSFSTARPAPQG